MQMFDHRHYVPILKGKDGEFNALREQQSRAAVTPLIELVPPGALSPLKRFEQTISKIRRSWGQANRFFYDMLYVPTESVASNGVVVHAATHVFSLARHSGLLAIPVVGTSSRPTLLAAIKDVIEIDQRGACIRLFSYDVQTAAGAGQSLDRLREAIGTDSADTDLIIDLRSTETVDSTVVAAASATVLSRIPNIGSWRTITIASAAFPQSLAAPMVRGWNERPRNDWLGWRTLATSGNVERLPSYGDYTISHPGMPPAGRGTTLAQLRYTTLDRFLIYKGHDVQEHEDGYDQFHAICAEMIRRPEYRQPDFSWGDAQIQEKATSEGDGGGASTWRGYAVSHHIATALDQIASLP